MTTTNKTAPADTEDEAPFRRRRGAIAFRSFAAMPKTPARLCIEKKVSQLAMRLWIALLLEAGGKTTVTVSNQALMDAANVGKNPFAPAREELREAGVLTFAPADKLRENYTYDLEPTRAQIRITTGQTREIKVKKITTRRTPANTTTASLHSSWGDED